MLIAYNRVPIKTLYATVLRNESNALLLVFRERYKSVVKPDLIPASFLAFARVKTGLNASLAETDFAIRKTPTRRRAWELTHCWLTYSHSMWVTWDKKC